MPNNYKEEISALTELLEASMIRIPISRSQIITIAKNLYANDYRKQRKGRWKGAGLGDYYCSICNTQYSGSDEYNFCPNCSAKMREGE